MPKQHRYTGAFPPPDVLGQLPNWTYALDEEGEEGQDETTLRPEEEQTYITEYTALSAADVWLASGERRVAVAYILDGIGIAGLHVAMDGDWWELRYDTAQDCWLPFVPTWMPEAERPPLVSLSDPSIFPLRFTMRLPFEAGGQPFSATIGSDGREHESQEETP